MQAVHDNRMNNNEGHDKALEETILISQCSSDGIDSLRCIRTRSECVRERASMFFVGNE